jgi:hypothetical protein
MFSPGFLPRRALEQQETGAREIVCRNGISRE